MLPEGTKIHHHPHSIKMLSPLFLISLLVWSCLLNAAAPAGKNTTPDSSFTVNSLSVGGGSRCITGNIMVTVTSPNLQIKYSQPTDQLAATEFIVEMLQANSDLARRVVGGPKPVFGTYSIYSSLCLPANPEAARNVKTVQFLTHGDTLSSSYWDIAPGYSYIDSVTAAGYAAFSYDRIGVGKSEHPDPIQIVQGPMQVEIAHALVTLLRNGRIGQYKFCNFVGVGHSAGSTVTQGVTTEYPKDFDAIILTGTSTVATYVPLSLAGFDLQIANQASEKFRGLPNGYLTQANAIGIQFGFFRYPNFDPKSKSLCRHCKISSAHFHQSLRPLSMISRRIASVSSSLWALSWLPRPISLARSILF